MTDSLNAVTNPTFRKFGFVETGKAPKPEWGRPGAIAAFYELPKSVYSRTVVFKDPEFSFLRVNWDGGEASHDLLVWRQYLALALTRSAGVHGSAIHIDILHHSIEEQSIIIRTEKRQCHVVWDAISAWEHPSDGVVLRVIKVSDYLTSLL